MGEFGINQICGDQVAREGEKYRYPHQSAGESGNGQVVENDKGHSNGAQTIEGRDILLGMLNGAGHSAGKSFRV